MRIFAAFIAESQTDFIDGFFVGKKISDMKDNRGNKMKDYILRQRLAEYDAKLDLVYRNFSEYVHLAEKAFYSSVTTSSSEQYAVQLLERIKHYLYDDRITFVFSVNLGELQHTIKHYYGNTFDACRYLDRFFDMRISLPPADKTAFYREMGLESSYVLEKICRKVIDTYNMELREATRFYRQVKTAAYEPTHESRKFDFSFSDEKGRQLLLMYVVPILVGLKIVDISLYNQFVCGKSSKPLMDIYKDSDKGEWLATRLLNRNEAFEVEEGKSVVTVEQKIQQLYDAIFVTEYTGNVYHTILGEYEFDDNSKNFVKSVESMLSVYADYNI